MRYWWIALLIVAIAAIEAVVVWFLRNDRKASMALATAVASILLVWKVIEFGYYRAAHMGLYPVEFSHMSYFVIGVTVCFGIKKMRAFAGICGVIAGLGYIVASVFSPDSIITEASQVYYIPMAIISHSLLWLAGLLLLFNVDKYSLKDIWVSLTGVCVMVAFSLLVNKGIIYKDFIECDDMMIIKVIDGSIVGFLIGKENLTTFKQAITATVLMIAFIGLIISFYFINNAAFKKREKNGTTIKHADFEVGLLQMLRRRNVKAESKSE